MVEAIKHITNRSCNKLYIESIGHQRPWPDRKHPPEELGLTYQEATDVGHAEGPLYCGIESGKYNMLNIMSRPEFCRQRMIK